MGAARDGRIWWKLLAEGRPVGGGGAVLGERAKLSLEGAARDGRI